MHLARQMASLSFRRFEHTNRHLLFFHHIRILLLQIVHGKKFNTTVTRLTSFSARSIVSSKMSKRRSKSLRRCWAAISSFEREPFEIASVRPVHRRHESLAHYDVEFFAHIGRVYFSPLSRGGPESFRLAV